MRTNLSFGLIQLSCHRPCQKKFNTLDFEIFCQRHTEFCSPPSHFSGFLQPFYGLFSSRFCPGLTAFFPIMFYFLLISTCNLRYFSLLWTLLSSSLLYFAFLDMKGHPHCRGKTGEMEIIQLIYVGKRAR